MLIPYSVYGIRIEGEAGESKQRTWNILNVKGASRSNKVSPTFNRDTAPCIRMKPMTSLKGGSHGNQKRRPTKFTPMQKEEATEIERKRPPAKQPPCSVNGKSHIDKETQSYNKETPCNAEKAKHAF